MELPRRWGPNGYFSGGKDTVSCRTLPVDERYFSSGPLAALVQARWHPGSITDSHLLILTAENTMRWYNIDSSGVNLLQVWQIGPVPTAMPPTSSKLPYLAGLGDTAVDFDFLPPECKTENKPVNNKSTSFTNYSPIAKHSCMNVFADSTLGNVLAYSPDNTRAVDRKLIYWPIAVLNGCGDVYMVAGRFDTHKPEISKPFSMMPDTSDNYGLDCCAILVLDCVPPILVIAGSKGVLHHCVLMSIQSDDSKSFVQADHKLFVLESVELQLGLNLKSAVSKGPLDYCPLRLHKDTISNARYLVYHSSGVHSVLVPAVHQLDQFLELDDDADLELNAPDFSIRCSAEYLLCTNLSRKSKATPENLTQQTGVVGLTIFGCPPTLITLLGNGQVISLPLTCLPLALPQKENIPDSVVKNIASPTKKLLKEPFDQHISSILKQKFTQPILKLGDDMSASQTYDVVTKALKVLRDEYFTKLIEARQEIEKRIHTLQMLKKQQLKDIKKLVDEKVDIQNRAEKLADKYEEVHEKQESLTKRAEMILRSSSRLVPKVTQAEREFFDKVKQLGTKVNYFKAQILSARQNIEKQKLMINQYESKDQKKDLYLNDNRLEAIKLNLQERTAQITQLMQDIKLIKNHLNLV
ncbi:nuclear pore complex protein Nup88-like isoform X2 [Ctenocephalides felis]|nr:nuclear pore complex protein Nup88-like isoform X2 [Ctenocephalides felis]